MCPAWPCKWLIRQRAVPGILVAALYFDRWKAGNMGEPDRQKIRDCAGRNRIPFDVYLDAHVAGQTSLSPESWSCCIESPITFWWRWNLNLWECFWRTPPVVSRANLLHIYPTSHRPNPITGQIFFGSPWYLFLGDVIGFQWNIFIQRFHRHLSWWAEGTIAHNRQTLKTHFLINPCLPTALQNNSISNDLTDINSSTDSSKLLTVKPKSSLEVFPNPFARQVQIRYLVSSECSGNVSLYLRDFTGRQIKTILRQTNVAPGNYQFVFDGSGLAPGVYFYELIICNGTQVVKKVEKISDWRKNGVKEIFPAFNLLQSELRCTDTSFWCLHIDFQHSDNKHFRKRNWHFC